MAGGVASSLAADPTIPQTGPVTADASATSPEPARADPASAVRTPNAEQIGSERRGPQAGKFQALLKGAGLDGWVVQDGADQAWRREGDAIVCTRGGGGWLRTQAVYSDFVFRFEYKLSSGGNTGVGLRAPSEGNPTFTGMEVQLLDDSAAKYSDLRPDQYTGSLYYLAAPQTRAMAPADEWNCCEIRCEGDRIAVTINGVLVNDVNLKPTTAASKPAVSLSERPPLGHVSLQSHSTRTEFRKLEILNLCQRTPTELQYVDLEVGSGPEVTPDSLPVLHYVGQLTDGKRFTDTREYGEPVAAPLNQMIDGWQEGLRGMRVGGKRRLIVPPHLGYGADGVPMLIPPHATLVFEIELCGLERSN